MRESWNELDYKKAYLGKMGVLGAKYPEVTREVFYRDLFPTGQLQAKGVYDDGKANAILNNILIRHGKKYGKRYVLSDGLEDLGKMDYLAECKPEKEPLVLIHPLSFFGKAINKEMAHEVYAMTIDIDYVGVPQTENIIKQATLQTRMLRPSYIVSSGKGVHLYWMLEKPIPLFKSNGEALTQLKRDIVNWLWNETTSLKKERDIETIYQGFRAVGSISKLGKNYPVRAWKVSDERYKVEDFYHFDYFSSSVDPSDIKLEKVSYKDMGLEYPKKAAPDKGKITQGWTNKPDLYEWWKRKISNEAVVGGRYYSIVALIAFGQKCAIPKKTVEKDAYGFVDLLEGLTETDDNHFTRADVSAAFHQMEKTRISPKEFTRKHLEDRTKIPIPPSHRDKDKRLKQKDHLKIARQIQDIRDPNGEWRNRDGASTKQQIVLDWRAEHPDGKKADCIKETGLSKPTVYKWWKGE